MLYVQFSHLSALEPRFGDPKGPLLNPHVFSRNLQAFLKGTNEDISTGYLGGEGNKDIVVARDGGLQDSKARLDGTAEFPPEVELPRGVEA